MSDEDPRTGALETAFCQLVAMLGRSDHIAVTQLARALEDAATTSKTSAESNYALVELARKLRNP